MDRVIYVISSFVSAATSLTNTDIKLAPWVNISNNADTPSVSLALTKKPTDLSKVTLHH